jgi:Phosphotransferase enzyme family
MEEILTALQIMGESEGCAFRLLGRYPGGEIGAYQIENEGQRFALKLGPERRVKNAAATTQVLREFDYPVPRYRTVDPLPGGQWYAVLDEMPGRPLDFLTLDLADEALALIEVQAGRAVLPAEEPRVVDTLMVGGDGYAVHDTMRDYSSETADLLDKVVAIGRQYLDIDFPEDDIVHFDFQPANMLVLDGRVSGLVDWEGTRSGDRAFDIATLLFYQFEDEVIQANLWQRLLGIAGPARASVYLAHMMLRQVEWSARHHDAATVNRHLARSRELLMDLRKLA